MRDLFTMARSGLALNSLSIKIRGQIGSRLDLSVRNKQELIRAYIHLVNQERIAATQHLFGASRSPRWYDPEEYELTFDNSEPAVVQRALFSFGL